MYYYVWRRSTRFIGICQWKNVPKGFTHETKMQIDPKHALNATMEQRLRDYFRPFNLLLYELIGEDFGY
jgi:hypothetical protein